MKRQLFTYSVTFRTVDYGYTFELFSNARKALTFARQATNTDGSLVKHTVELRQVQNGAGVYFYNKDDERFTVRRSYIN